MKNIIFFILSFTSLSVYAQSEGIFYQAVIENLDDINLPGTNSNGNFLPNTDIVVNFKISDDSGIVIYEEYHLTKTDSEGMIHLRIGSGLAPSSNFNEIEWHGDPKNLEVSINYDNNTFVERDFKELLFIPYAYHRDMIVTQNLSVAGNSLFNGNLTVNGITNLNDQVRVNNNSSTELSGDLTVDGESKINDNLSVLNQSNTLLTGKNEVNLNTSLNDSLEVNGITKINDSTAILNNRATYLSGSLEVDLPTNLNARLQVNNNTTLNDSLSVMDASPTQFSGELNVLNEVFLNNNLTVNGIVVAADSLIAPNNTSNRLTGTLDILGETYLNSSLNVHNLTELYSHLNVSNGNTNFSGPLDLQGNAILNDKLDVIEQTTFLSDFNVENSGNTKFSDSLVVNLNTVINQSLNINQNKNIQQNLAVNGLSIMDTLNLNRLVVQTDFDNEVSLITNTNPNNGDGLLIKLGKTHGLWNNGSYYDVQTFSNSTITPVMNSIRGWANGQTVTASSLISIIPPVMLPGALSQINKQIVQHITDSLGVFTFPTLGDAVNAANNVGLPIDVPLNIPTLFNGYNIGGGRACLPRICIRIFGRRRCTPTHCENIPVIRIPSIDISNMSLHPPGANLLPRIPPLPIYGGLPELQLAVINFPVVPNSLTNDNEYIRFEDKEGRVAGKIKAESTLDYTNRTKLSDSYVFELLGSLINIDALELSISGNNAFNQYANDFNELGVEYSSGNGDYAEWLERIDHDEKITAGDIVSVKGGKITKNKEDFEQILVVSHRPIIHGNTPPTGEDHNGNKVAFLGQVPIKVIGPVEKGDYIIFSDQQSGYGKARKSQELELEDYKKIAGQAWENNLNQGPKIINCLVGKTSKTWIDEVTKYEKKQSELEQKIQKIENKFKKVIARNSI